MDAWKATEFAKDVALNHVQLEGADSLGVVIPLNSLTENLSSVAAVIACAKENLKPFARVRVYRHELKRFHHLLVLVVYSHKKKKTMISKFNPFLLNNYSNLLT